MKVLFFQPYLAAWRVEFLSRFIDDFEGDVIVVDGGHLELEDKKSVSTNSAGFRVIKLWSANRIFSVLRFPYPVYFSPGLLPVLIRERPDAIVTEGEINIINNISVIIYSMIFRKNFYWWSLGKVRANSVGILPRILRPVVSYMLMKARRIIARNSLARSYYIDNVGVDQDKIIVAPNSMDEKKARREVDIDLTNHLKNKTGPALLYVGALTAAKRPGDLIEALPIIESLTDGRVVAEAWYVGSGPERERLQNMATKMDLSHRVKFFGRVTEGVGSYFSAADVVVVPGLGGLVINHAMIFGVPVVSRSADGTELDLIENAETGFVVTDDSNSALAMAIEKVIAGNVDGSMSRKALLKVDQDWNMGIMISRFKEALSS